MEAELRTERPDDFEAVYRMISRAFDREDEARLVTRLRLCPAFDPDLSIVAETPAGIAGHVLFTRITVDGPEPERGLLALAPVAVEPEMQRQGIGSRLIREGLAHARETGFAGVVVLGHADYYPRFGFEPASRYGLRCPFPVPDENFLALELLPGALEGAGGIIVYAAPFLDL